MVTVLRLGERASRDYRVNTHLALVARAFGVQRLVMTFRDENVERSLDGVNRRFGSRCSMEYEKEWAGFIREWNGYIVHLTMYGETLGKSMELLRGAVSVDTDKCICDPDVLVIIGSEKVQRKVYELADINTSVGNQPHSEIAALSIFLDRLFEGRQFDMEYGGEWKILPDPAGKSVVKNLPEEESQE
jgi:tRNA (cytidine56-2'-O)-methyltransferase